MTNPIFEYHGLRPMAYKEIQESLLNDSLPNIHSVIYDWLTLHDPDHENLPYFEAFDFSSIMPTNRPGEEFFYGLKISLDEMGEAYEDFELLATQKMLKDNINKLYVAGQPYYGYVAAIFSINYTGWIFIAIIL